VFQIAGDLRGMAVHDISHLDALWDSVFSVAEAVDINPPEAFVFASILLMMQRQQGQIEPWQGNCTSSSS
jgi:hypothetical protein